MTDSILWWGSGSVPCWRAMLALEEKRVKYDGRLISFDKNETKGPDVMKYNPRGEVPTFVDGDVVVNESMAICDYLEFKYNDQGNRLLPTDVKERAVVLQRQYEALNLFKKGLEQLIYELMEDSPDLQDQETLKARLQVLSDELKLWEGYLQTSEGYIAGQSFTMADVMFFPLVAFLVRLGLQLKKYPNINKYYENLVTRPSVKATWPPHWVDSVGKDWLKDA
ncbi:unnamed protein product [Owenia fusiformis]|uniref:Uncharacterized protein n=1 Tax=Owenia fusiformis TaxID=6347 RepID=A0A8J1TVT7_OWEFU|nr:unnamed protein product [Owenia fusiformis]